MKKSSLILLFIFINISLFAGSFDNPLYWGKFEEPVHLKFARPVLLDKNGNDALVDTIWTKTWKEKFNITVENIWNLPNLKEINKYISNGVFTGDLPDYMILNKNNFEALYEAGRLQNLSSYEKYMTPFLKYKIYDFSNTGVQRVGIIDGDRYAIVKEHYYQTKNGFFVRKDFLDAIGVNQPKNIEELVSYSKEFVDKGLCKYAFDFSYNLLSEDLLNINLFLNAYGSYGDMWLKNDRGRYYNSLTTDESKAALDVLRELYRDGYISDKIAKPDDTQNESCSLSQKSDIGVLCGSYKLIDCPLSSIKDKNGNDTDWNIYTSLSSKNNWDYHISGASSKADDTYISISADCQNPEALIRTMNFKAAVLSDPTYMDKSFNTQILDDGSEISNHLNCLLSGYFNSSKCENVPDSKVITYAIDNDDISKLTGNTLMICNRIKAYMEHVDKGEPFSGEGWKYYKLYYADDSFFGQLKNNIDSDFYKYDDRESPTSYYDLLHESLNKYANSYYVEYIMGTNECDFDEFKCTFMNMGGRLIADELNYL